MTLNTSLLVVMYYTCTSTHLYQSVHKIGSVLLHQLQRYNWGKMQKKPVKWLWPRHFYYYLLRKSYTKYTI